MPEFTVEVRTTGTVVYTVVVDSVEDIDLTMLDQVLPDDEWEDERWINIIEPSGY